VRAFARARTPGELTYSRSLKLIRGELDQVAGTAHISWVQPRVLRREQIAALAGRLEAWCTRLGAVEQRIQPELLVGA
jgi:26S proteasome regulatory subunit N9